MVRAETLQQYSHGFNNDAIKRVKDYISSLEKELVATANLGGYKYDISYDSLRRITCGLQGHSNIDHLEILKTVLPDYIIKCEMANNMEPIVRIAWEKYT